MSKPTINKEERKLSRKDQWVLAQAREGKRTADMGGWTFKIGRYGLAKRKAYLTQPFGQTTWFWVGWCLGDEQVAAMTPEQRTAALGVQAPRVAQSFQESLETLGSPQELR